MLAIYTLKISWASLEASMGYNQLKMIKITFNKIQIKITRDKYRLRLRYRLR